MQGCELISIHYCIFDYHLRSSGYPNIFSRSAYGSSLASRPDGKQRGHSRTDFIVAGGSLAVECGCATVDFKWEIRNNSFEVGDDISQVVFTLLIRIPVGCYVAVDPACAGLG
ncbi:MAG: hypothetical protein ACYTF1_20620 [Planctomycetota bacterium]